MRIKHVSEGSDISNILIISKLGNDSNVNSIQWAVSNFSSPRKTLGSCLWPGFKLEFMEKNLKLI